MNPADTGSPTAARRSSGRDEQGPFDERLLEERERALNFTDQLMGARAEAAQARAEIRELEYRLHVREAELAELRRLLQRFPGPETGRSVAALVAAGRSGLGRVARRAGLR